MNSSAWHRIGAAGGAVALAVDMDGTARRDATFRDLSPMLDDGWELRLASMPEAASATSADDLLAGWLRDHESWAPEVEAVLGYCAGGLFALAIADHVEDARGTRPEVVLFDPELPTSATFHRDFTGGLNEMSALQSEEREAYSRRAQRTVRDHGTDLEQCVRGLLELYGEACRANLARLGVPADIAADLESAFRSYGAYIVGASRIEHDFRWEKVTALVSADADADGFDCRRIQTDVDKRNLLQSRAVAAQVRELLERT